MPGYMWPVITVVPSAGSIVDSMVSASAAIDLTKLASTGVIGSGCFEIVSSSAVSVHNGAGLVVGHTAKLTTGAADEFQVLGTAAADSRALLGRFSADALGPDLDFLKSRHATLGSNTIVQDNDVLGRLCWYPADGANFATLAATFRCEVDDASPAAGDVGVAFVWSMMPGGAGAIADKLQLTAAGVLGPCANDGVALGTSALAFSDAYFASGAVIGFGAGDVNITHSANTLTIGGGDLSMPANGITIGDGNALAFGSAAERIYGNSGHILVFQANSATRFQIGEADSYFDTNLCFGGTTTAGATAAKTVCLGNSATAPTTSADRAHLYAADCAGAGTAALALYQEDGVRVAAGVASTNSIPVVFNGTTYYLLCTTVRS